MTSVSQIMVKLIRDLKQPSEQPGKGAVSTLDTFCSSYPTGSDGKESACHAGDLGSIPGSGRFPGGGHDNPLQYSCLENPHGQRSLVGSIGLQSQTRLND